MSLAYHRDYLTRLPQPLAQLYSRAYNAKDARGRHDHTFYLFEAAIKLAAAPLVAEYLREVARGSPRVTELDHLLAQLALPSLGQWVGILRELARYFGSRVDAAAHPLGHLWSQLYTQRRDLPGVLALYRRIKNGPDGAAGGDQSCSLLQLLDALVQYRNAVFGHGAGRFESFYEQEMGPLLFPAANEILAEGVFDLLGPRGSRLVYLTELRVVDEGHVELSLSDVVVPQSERLAPLTLTAEEAAGLAPNCLAVQWPGRRVPLRLDPLLVFRTSDLGEEVLFLNRDRNGRQVEYLSYATGRTERDRAMAPALAQLLSRIVGHEVQADDLDRLAEASLAETPSVEALFGEARTAGQVLGDYEILAELGRGGMGVVYLARQQSLGRIVALKMLPADLGGDEVALARFRREIRSLARCDHPHIVKVLASGTLPDGQLYYTMEYVPGADLELVWRELAAGSPQATASSLGSTTWSRAVLSASQKQRASVGIQPLGCRSGLAVEAGDSGEPQQPKGWTPTGARPDLPLPPLPELPALDDAPGGYARRVAVLMRDAALALQAVHDQKTVHRDVKPANLMLTPDGSRVVLMDFGLAKGQSLSLSASRAGGFLGTLRYAAPEQLAAATLQVGPQADVRGLGVTLWELLTRQRAFGDAEDEKQLAAMIYDRDLPRVRAVDATLDADLEAIVARATERSVEDRIQTARELAEYLDLYLAGQPLPIRPPGVGELLRRWVRHHAAFVATAATVVLTIVVAFAISFVWVTKSRNDALDAKGKAENLAASEAEAKRKADQSNAALKRQLGRNLIERGLSDCVSGHKDRGVALLAQAYSDLSAIEDSLADSALQLTTSWGREIGIPLRHEGHVEAACFSPDGRTVLTGSRDDTARLWDAATGKPLGEPLRHEGGVNAVSFSPDGRTVLTGSDDNTARLWDAATGKPLGEPLSDGYDVIAVSFSPDGRTVLTGSGHDTARRWDAATGKPLGEPFRHEGEVGAVSFSPDGRTVLTGSDDETARLWDAATGKPLGEPLRHEGRVLAVSFSPDGRTVLTGSWDKTARLWDSATGKPLGEPLRHEGTVGAVSFSPDGRTVLTGSGDDTARLWDAATGKPLGEPFRHEGGVRAVSFSPDGRTVLTGSDDKTARLWDAATGKPLGEPLRHEITVFAVLTGSEDKTARLWDAATGKPLCEPLRHEGSVVAVSFSPDDRTVLTGSYDKTARLWDAATGKPLCEPLPHEGTVVAVSFSPDGRTVLTGSGDKTARLWDAATGKPLCEPLRHEGGVRAVSFSPDGRTVLTGSDDNTARLWDAATGKPLGEPLRHEGRVNAVSFSPDGRTVLTGSDDNTARLWDAATGKPLGEPLRHEGGVNAVSFSPDGRTVLTGTYHKSARLWDVTTGKPVGEPLRHEGWGSSPDGRTVLTVNRDNFMDSRDQMAQLWVFSKPIDENPQRLSSWLKVRTAWEVDQNSMLRRIPVAEWFQRWESLADSESRLFDAMKADAERTRVPWHRGQATESEFREQWFAAAFHWTQLLQREPSNSEFLRRRGAAYRQQRKLMESQADLNRAVELSPSDAAAWNERGHVNAELSHWREAAGDFAKARDLSSEDSSVWCRLGYSQLAGDDIPGHGRTCQEMLTQFSATQDVAAANAVAWLAVLTPAIWHAEREGAALVRLAKLARDDDATDVNALDTFGAVLYRTGRSIDAEPCLRKVVAKKGDEVWASTCYFLAMTCQQLGRRDEARQWLDKGIAWSEKETDWQFRVINRVLRQETEALLGSDLKPGEEPKAPPPLPPPG